jgi:DNA-binding NarL/FixJ family response regulator
MIENSGEKIKEKISIFNESKDPLDVMSTVCEANPSLLIIDDDFLAPETVHILKSIRKVNRGIDIIFCTSNSSIALGKEVSQLGIQYYAIKPFDDGELQDSINAVLNSQRKKSQHLTN